MSETSGSRLRVVAKSLTLDPRIAVLKPQGVTDVARGEDPVRFNVWGDSLPDYPQVVSQFRFLVAPVKACFDVKELEELRLGLVPEVNEPPEGARFVVFEGGKDKFFKEGYFYFGTRNFFESVGSVALTKQVQIDKPLPGLPPGANWKIKHTIDLEREIHVLVYPSLAIAELAQFTPSRLYESGGIHGIDLSAGSRQIYGIPASFASVGSIV